MSATPSPSLKRLSHPALHMMAKLLDRHKHYWYSVNMKWMDLLYIKIAL
jgi:hypothetical protein